MSEAAVLERYSEGAQERQEALCCPVDYDTSLLALLPEEVIEKDYGCGDPSRYVREGDIVLDLGSGSGKICYMAAQLLGEKGRVIGVDINDDMLALARKYQAEMAGKLGGDRVRFVKGQIQDLALDVEALESWLSANPVTTAADLTALEAGFQAISFDKWSAEPWQTVEGIEFRSLTLTATKPEGNECLDSGHAVIYRGPFSAVEDDEGHEFPRGERMAVCERTFQFLTEGPFKDNFIGIIPAQAQEAVAWCAASGTRRPPSETKGARHLAGDTSESCC